MPRAGARAAAFHDASAPSIFSLKNEPERGSEAIRDQASFLILILD
jgi:hypothetical protein